MPGKRVASSCWRKRKMRLSRSSSFTRRVRRRSSEKVLRRNSPSVRGRSMSEPPNTFRNYTREGRLRAWVCCRSDRKIKIFTTEETEVHGVNLAERGIHPSVDVAVAAGSFARGGGSAKVRNDGLEIADQ